MTNITRDYDKGYKRVLRAVNQRGSVVRVGVMGPKGSEPKTGGKSTATVAQVAAYNHEGTAHIPSRPFIAIWFDENVDANRLFARRLAAQRFAGRMTMDQSLNAMGVYAKGGIQKRMATGPFEPNAESTLKKKAPKTKPLIVTGQTRSSVTSEVVGRA